jgi:cytochrome c-type biogenesis protein CcmH/NrfF
MSGGAETQTSYYARTPFEATMQHEIVCTCGCGHTTIAECRKDPCGTSHKMRGEVATLIDQGKTHDEIIDWFVKSYGSEEMLGAPRDRGFSRLAWMFPYLMGGGGVVAIAFAAMKWSRHPSTTPGAAPVQDDTLEARIDDELRNLD